MKTRFRSSAARLPVVLVAAVGWLELSNHCALAAVERSATKPAMSCHGLPTSQHPPANDKRGDVECCKTVRATLLTPAKSVVSLDDFLFTPYKYFVALVIWPNPDEQARFFEWDTGPPAALSFSESVLQRSILSHAPPLLA